MVIDDMLSTGHARALLALENKEEQYAAAVKIFDEKMSVRDTEKACKSFCKIKNLKNRRKNLRTALYIRILRKKLRRFSEQRLQ